MAAKLELCLDCNDGERAAAFWAAALGYRIAGTSGQYWGLADPDGHGPTLVIQQVAEPKVGKNRVHFDLKVADIEAEAARLVSLGATRVTPEPFEEHGGAWIVLHDPEGNEFCVCRT
jgi:predicted enzyme related to lactoylglutathione lyase